MLGQYLNADDIDYRQSVADWKEAVDIVAKPLLERGTITPDYVTAIKSSIAGPNGTYIDLGGGVALAHARPETGVVHTSLSVMHVTEAFLLADDPAHPITTMFCLAAQDSNSHIELMQALAGLLTDQARRERLDAARSVEDLVEVLCK